MNKLIFDAETGEQTIVEMSESEVAAVSPPPPSARDQLDAMWAAMAAALPIEQRAQLRILKIAVVDALDAEAYDEAAALIASQPVPPQFEQTKNYALKILQNQNADPQN